MRRLAPVAGDQVVVLAVHRVQLVAGLVADDLPVRAERAGLQPGPAEHRVRAEESQVDAAVAGGGDGRPLLRGPVLVVARRDQRARAVQRVRIAGDVHAGQVGQRQPEPLGQVDQLALVDHEEVRAVDVTWPVQADYIGPVGVAAAGPLIQVVLAPGVVGLPGRHRVLQHYLAGRAGGPDCQRHVPLRAGIGSPAGTGNSRAASRRSAPSARRPTGCARSWCRRSKLAAGAAGGP